eukprot:9742091-Lingulodinium_polyedra.AAC.1
MAANLQNFLRQQYPQRRCEGHATEQGDVGEASKHRCPCEQNARQMTRTQTAGNGAGLIFTTTWTRGRPSAWNSRGAARNSTRLLPSSVR